MSTTEPATAVATSFQVGLRCPACQGTVAIGDAIASCRKCATTHHAACWTSIGRCSSYHCDTRTQAETPSGRADIVITADEASRIVLPPKRVPVPTADLAARLEQGPRSLSPAAVIAFATGFLLLGATAVLAWKGQEASQAIALAALCGVLGSFVVGIFAAISAGSIFRDRARKGLPFALLGLLECVGAGAFSVVAIVGSFSEKARQGNTASFSMADPEPPAPETFDKAPPTIANAMRANVFVAGRGKGLLAAQWCGAGVVLGTRQGTTYLLTNAHVIAGPVESGQGEHELSLKFANGEMAEATVEWRASGGVDLGILSCRVMRPPRVATRIRKDVPQVSEKLFAIGNPHELSWTYTEGVASRVYEKHTAGGASIEVIQTQTPIMPGNSGGGLYDTEGRLVGVNTWVVDVANGGPGFAISCKTILAQVPQQYLSVTLADEGDDSTDGGRR